MVGNETLDAAIPNGGDQESSLKGDGRYNACYPLVLSLGVSFAST